MKASTFYRGGLIFCIIFSTCLSAQAYTGILSFGDSLSDNGPADGYGFNTSSNGVVWVEYLAGSSHFNADLLDMAYGGATTDQGTIRTGYSDVYGLQWQVDTYFKEVASTVPDDTLITVWAGSNDMLMHFITGGVVQQYSAENAAANIGSALQNLIRAGGQDFLVPTILGSGDFPNALLNDWAELFNDRLEIVIADLINHNPGINIFALDMAGMDDPPEDWVKKPYTWTSPDPARPINEYTYVFYDNVHPTTEYHELIADYAASAVPVPPAFFLLLTGLMGLHGIRRIRNKK